MHASGVERGVIESFAEHFSAYLAVAAAVSKQNITAALNKRLNNVGEFYFLIKAIMCSFLSAGSAFINVYNSLSSS